jgi:hypothetical protein
VDAGVGLLAIDDDENSVLILPGCVSRKLSSKELEIWSTVTQSPSIPEARMIASSLAIRSLRLSLVSRAASWSSSRLCSVHLFPRATQLSHTVESFAKMHRTFRFLHSKQLWVPFLMPFRADGDFGWDALSECIFLCLSSPFQILVREGRRKRNLGVGFPFLDEDC